MTTKTPLYPSRFYHIFNRGNNGEPLFFEEKNYTYFLHLLNKYLEPVAQTYAYCFLKNHFHLLVRILDEPLLRPWRGFANLFCTYSKAINRGYDRTGSLFENPFHRIPVTDPTYLKNLVVYIHLNPQRHNFVDDFTDWPHSSFHTITSNPESDVLSWFGGLDPFLQAHTINPSSWEPALLGVPSGI